METDGHEFQKPAPIHSLLFSSLVICVYPWFKKHFMIWLSLGFWLLTAASAGAQIAPADDFFHSGAQSYITNNIAQAKQIVEQGRKLYPDDEKLKKLEALLNQQQQQQQQQNQQQQKQDQSQQQKSDDQKNQDQQQQPKDSDDQKKQDEQKKNQEDQKKEEQKKQAEQKKPDDQKKDGDKKDEEAQPVKAGEMTPEEAKRLLDSQKGNEQLLQLKPQEKPRKNNRPIKDW